MTFKMLSYRPFIILTLQFWYSVYIRNITLGQLAHLSLMLNMTYNMNNNLIHYFRAIYYGFENLLISYIPNIFIFLFIKKDRYKFIFYIY